jgi:hypothetical protein
MLGEMLGTETVVNTPCAGGCRQRGNGCNLCGAQVRNAAQNARMGGCCEFGSQGMCARNENLPHNNGHLASACPGEPSLAMVYSPHQTFDNIYSTEEALEHGTLFVELDKPWKVGGCR